MLLRGGVMVGVLCAGFAAQAWPVDLYEDVDAAKEKFIRLPSLDWFEIEDVDVLSAEWLASGELLLVPRKPGRTLMLLYADGVFAVWRVRVGAKPVVDKALQDAALKQCPKITFAEAASDSKLTGVIHDDACRLALGKWLSTDGVQARDLEVVFDGKALQAQLKSIEAGLSKLAPGAVKARYVGGGLVLEGKLPLITKRKALWDIFRRTVGRVALDDKVVLADVPPTEPQP